MAYSQSKPNETIRKGIHPHRVAGGHRDHRCPGHTRILRHLPRSPESAESGGGNEPPRHLRRHCRLRHGEQQQTPRTPQRRAVRPLQRGQARPCHLHRPLPVRRAVTVSENHRPEFRITRLDETHERGES